MQFYRNITKSPQCAVQCDPKGKYLGYFYKDVILNGQH